MRLQTISRAILTIVFIYLSTFGATFNGILIPELRWVTLFLIGGLGGLWFLMHIRMGWRWYRTPLDGVLIMWGIAIALSMIVNMDVWHRSIMALWFVMIYMLVWYALADGLANRGITKEILIEACIMGGVAIVFFGYFQFFIALERGEIARVGSLVGNPNSLGAFLLFLLTLIIGRALMVKNRIARRLLGVYGLMTAILLAITFSRGAWFGMVASIGVLLGLHLYMRQLSPKKLLEQWQIQSTAFKIMTVGGIVASLAILIGAGWAVLQSLNQQARSLDLRGDIYGVAVRVFEQHPIAGAGLFTFGGEFATYQSQPPRQPHSHPHHGILLVMAELGLIGIMTLIVAVGMTFRVMWRNWQQADMKERGFLAIGIAGAIGFGVHHLLDFPAMMPLIALCGLLPLLIAVIPKESVLLEARWRMIGHPISMGVLVIIIVLVGVWRTSAYSAYTHILASPFAPESSVTYLQAAQALDDVIALDPFMPIYHQQQGYLYGLAAWDGDISALPHAISAYERFLAQVPTHAISWANLAHLYWQSGDMERAIEAQQRAVALASGASPFRFTLATYLEASDNMADALSHYQRALTNATALWLVWDDIPQHREVLGDFSFSDSQQLIIALANNTPTDWMLLWRESEYFNEKSTRASILWLMVTLRLGESVDSVSILAEAQSRANNRIDEAWVLLGEAEILRFAGETDMADERLASARARIAPRFNVEDITFATNVPYFQFLATVIPRQLLPDIFYPISDVVLQRLLN